MLLLLLLAAVVAPAAVASTQSALNLALMAAVDIGDADRVAHALAEGADPDTANQYSITCLHTAASRGDVPVLALLARQNASLNAALDYRAGHREGETPLHFAVSENRQAAVAYLVLSGADVNAATARGMAPLHLAAGLGHVESMMELLGESTSHTGTDRPTGADVNAPADNRFGSAPIHLAATSGKPAAVEFLLERGAAPHMPNKMLSYPIHGAAIVGDLDTVMLLLRNGADGQQLNGDGKSPLEMAEGRSEDPVVGAALEGLRTVLAAPSVSFEAIPVDDL